jgi:acetoin utilization deacetylase AcuC-like enzyme
VNWGGGRHHAHSSKAGGFCYVNDIVLAIKRLLQSDSVDDFGIPTPSRVLYIDIDIHHCDGVQQAFYSTDRVMTSSFHRNSPGFFPTTSGFVREKGEVDTVGFGYNLNVPLPSGIDDITFLMMYRKMLFGLVKSFDPDFIVLCVGADGLEGDALLNGQIYNSDHSSTGEGWSLSPEGLAECVRITSSLCAGLKEETICARPAKEEQHDEDTRGRGAETEIMNNARESLELGKRRKLLVLGGGGYSPAQTARANLLCTAAACEGARSGLLWSELPKDIPTHDYFPRYGPLFELVSEEKKQQIWDSYDVDCGAIGVTKDSSSPFFGRHALQQGIHAIELACLFIDRQRKKAANFNSLFESEPNDRDDDIWVEDIRRKKKTSQGGRRKKKKV